jgi:LuxR family maltose regulon positive regulatory protein
MLMPDDMPLQAKLRPPPPRADWVERRDLIDLLNHTAASRLVLLAAPAGYGKTTLLAQWCGQAAGGRSFAWVSLDEDDNDPAVLWRLIASALAQAFRTPGLKSVARSPWEQATTVGNPLLAGLVEELTVLDRPVTIVLDGYDAITDRDCHRQLRFLLSRLPSHAQLALATRSQPPLGLPRMRVRGQMTDLGPADLSMTSQDAALLITRLGRGEIGQRDLTELIKRTEGWPAGIYLMALALRGTSDRRRFLRSHAGGRQVTDFLTEEVINRQPAQIRQFLLRTSVLQRFTAPLCESITGSARAREIIGILDGESVFLVPLDDHQEWFRYHHLFADTLLFQLTHADPEAVPALRMRASAWHRRHGQPSTAIYYALAAGDAAAAIAVIAESWHRYAGSGRIATVQGWLAGLGADRIRASPLAAHCAAWIAGVGGDRWALTRWLAVVEAADPQGPLPDGMRSLEFSAALLRGGLGFGGIRSMAESSARAVALDPDPESEWRPFAMAASGMALYLSGRFAAAGQQLEQALWQPSALPAARWLAFTFGCLVAVEEGRSGRAAELAQEAREMAADQSFELIPGRADFAGLATGAVHASEGRLGEARKELTRALEARRRRPGLSPWLKFEISVRLAPVLQDLGDRPAAAALLAEARDVLVFFPEGAQAQLQRLGKLERRVAEYPRPVSGEPLTTRERAVLRWLDGALSLREIGKKMYVSPNTVKTHARSIYRKLGVSSRADAVARGRLLGLI